jgi:hypothetical protein
VGKVKALVAGEGKEVSQEESPDTVEEKLMGCIAKIRNELVQGITVKFPIKGLEMVVGQVFDGAIEKHFDSLLKILDLKHSPLKEYSSKVESSKSRIFDSRGYVYSHSKVKVSDVVERSEENVNLSPSTLVQTGAETDGKIDERVISEYQKRIDELILGIKARDSKILELKREIEKLQKSLELLQAQASSPFIYSASPNQEEAIHIQNQLRSMMEFMRRITPILNKDPKYKIMFFLKRVGKAPASKLSEELGIPPKELDSLIKELETMKIIRKEEETVFLTDVH